VSAVPHESVEGPCRNCGAEIPPVTPPARYCVQCGQETALHPPHLGEFLHEFIGHYIAIEGALWKTLGLLVLKPGRLTREYFEGRRRRYVLPLRLYLTASFLFFVVLKLLPSVATLDGSRAVVIDQPNATAAQKAQARERAASEALAALDDDERAEVEQARAAASAAGASAPRHRLRDCAGPASGADCGLAKRTVARVLTRWHDHPKEAGEHFKGLLFSLAPYAVFLLLPVFAAIVMLAYRRRHMLYGEHVVFSLHMHSFWFLALLLFALLPESVADMALFALPMYGVWAMRHVYGGRWGPTLLRALFVSVLYGAVLLLATLVLMLGALLMA
jgi:hypothetical protein